MIQNLGGKEDQALQVSLNYIQWVQSQPGLYKTLSQNTKIKNENPLFYVLFDPEKNNIIV